MASNEINFTGDLAAGKRVIDDVLSRQGFKVQYSTQTSGIAERGSKLASGIAGPFAGKKNVYVKLGISLQEANGGYSLYLTDENSGLGKALTFTGGATDKVIADILDEVRTALRYAGILA
jgi:N-acetylneuraminic acid mutarotase